MYPDFLRALTSHGHEFGLMLSPWPEGLGHIAREITGSCNVSVPDSWP